MTAPTPQNIALVANNTEDLKVGELSFNEATNNWMIGTGPGVSSIFAGVTASNIGSIDPLVANLGLPKFHTNTKTVFANPLALDVRIDRMMSDDKAMAVRMMMDAGEKLRRTVANETRCSGCAHFEIEVDERLDHLREVNHYRLRTICKKANPGMTGLICPNGDVTSRDGSFKQPQALELANWPVNLEDGEHSNPDAPSTPSDTAW